MVFSSIISIYKFIPIVLTFYYLVPKKWRNPVLFIANLFFYGWGEPVYIFLMLFSILINFINGYYVYKYLSDKKKAKVFLFLNAFFNLALLGFFKYYNFFAENLNAIPFISLPQLNLPLPIGISFYTFQMMSYPIDVYRGDADCESSIINFGTYVALFPQLIAGPIVRYKDLSDQLKVRNENLSDFNSGVKVFIVGLAKKVLIANNVGLIWKYYSELAPSSLTVLGAWIGILAFYFQIYFDFSGYSDIAIGLGRMFGFEFKINFDYPYTSQSITEFWRRWHMSLGTWFRDYVYIPLGGNRKGLKRQIVNIFIVWALTGIWHGANWNFLAWGLYFGIIIILEKILILRVLEKLPRIFRYIYTIFLVILSWTIFECTSLSDGLTYAGSLFSMWNNDLYRPMDLFNFRANLLLLLIAAVGSTPLPKKLLNSLNIKVQNILIPIGAAALLLLSTAYLINSSYNPFLYFRF